MAGVLKGFNSFRLTFQTTELLCLMDLDLIALFLVEILFRPRNCIYSMIQTLGTTMSLPTLRLLWRNRSYQNNSGYTSRLNYLGNSQTIELYGRLHADLFNSDRMLINGVDMNIKHIRAPEAFYLLASSDDTKVRVKILDAALFITPQN
jgi:hypothetical protein